jgi:ribosomal protein S12
MLAEAYIFGFFSTCQIVKVRPNNNTFETQIGFLYIPKVTMKLQVFVKDLSSVKYHCIQGVKDLQRIPSQCQDISKYD